MRDADSCGMGDEKPCPHGIRAGRYCVDCDAVPLPLCLSGGGSGFPTGNEDGA